MIRRVRGFLILVVSRSRTFRWKRHCARGRRLLALSLGESFHYTKHCWHKENPQRPCRQHPADHGRAHDLPGYRSCTRGGPQRDAPENEGKRGHQYGPEAKPGSLKCGIHESLTLVVLVLGEL